MNAHIIDVNGSIVDKSNSGDVNLAGGGQLGRRSACCIPAERGKAGQREREAQDLRWRNADLNKDKEFMFSCTICLLGQSH